MERISKQMGLRIKAIRKILNLTQEQLAERAGVHPSYIGRLERADINTTIDMLSSIVKALNVPFSAVLDISVGNQRKTKIITDLNCKLYNQNVKKLDLIKRVVDELCE
jgi:transcriptional regulator with XRE-family HTH domain